MGPLIQQLKHWQENGLLSEAQLQAILAYEQRKPKNSWALMGFLALGVAIVVLGIIAIIASNWMSIPDGVKLGSGFAILVGTAVAIYQLRSNPSVLITDGLKAFFALSCMAMIGLIAQIYHLKGEGYMTGLLWSAMTILVVSEAKNVFVPLFWTFVFGSSVLWGLAENPQAKAYLLEPYSLFILLLTAIFILLQSTKKDSVLTKAMGYAVILTWVFGLCFSSTEWNFAHKHGDRTYEFIHFLPHYMLSLLIGVSLIKNPSLKKMEKKFFAVGLLVANLLFSLNHLADSAYILLIVLSIVCLLTFAFFFLSREQSRLFNAVLIIISFKFFEFYLRKFGGLLSTGVGLICTGLVIVGLVAAWMQNRQKIEGHLKEWLL
jgi:uncharacterized membrane protein